MTTTIYFPSTWLYRHCAEWLKDREYSDLTIVTGLATGFPSSRYIFNTYTIEAKSTPWPKLDIANQFIKERFK
jgi:hypothetical protein